MAGKTEFSPLLPEGLHPKTLDEVEMICVHGFHLSTTRSIIMDGLRLMVQKLEQAGIQGDLWINGSFLTVKIDPEDVDIALRINELSLLDATPNQMALIGWFGSRDSTIVAKIKRDFLWGMSL